LAFSKQEDTMPARKYICTNFANCDAALSKQVIEIEEGEDPVCPTCGDAKSLAPSEKSGSGGGSGVPKGLLIGGAVVLLIALGWLVWPSGPRPETAQAMLEDFFPRLK
jgi:hypothetical protein